MVRQGKIIELVWTFLKLSDFIGKYFGVDPHNAAITDEQAVVGKRLTGFQDTFLIKNDVVGK